MESQRYQRINPVAAAVAAGCTELLFALLVGFRMMGMMAQYGHMGWGGPSFSVGAGLVWWLGGAVMSALAGAVFAWIYNAVNGSSVKVADVRAGDGGTTT